MFSEAEVDKQVNAVKKKVAADPSQFDEDVRAFKDLNASLPEHPDIVYARSPEGQAHWKLANLYQDFTSAVSEFKIEAAEEILKQDKEVAQTAGIAWESLPGGWKVTEADLAQFKQEMQTPPGG